MSTGNCRGFQELPGLVLMGAPPPLPAMSWGRRACLWVTHSKRPPHSLRSASPVLGTGRRRGVSPALAELLGPCSHFPAGLEGGLSEQVQGWG